jgi:WS/DGAT/MGAT family acyltransferase
MDREPTALELYSRALIHNVENVPALARFTLGTARRLATLGVGALGKMATEASAQLPSIRSILSGDLTGLLPKMPPQTRFSGNVSAHRIFEAVGLPLADFRVVRNCIPDATINDQFLAIVGGALREYLASKNELPDATMVAGVPLTLRGADKGGDRGNQVGFTLMPVHTEIEDPLERLKAISADSIKAKRMTDAIGKELARDLLDLLPNFVSGAMLRNVRMPRIGLIVSNVRGPDVPLYMAGARLVNYAPVSIPIDGLGLNVTGFSYAGTMWICAISCRDMLPDPGFFADCMRRSFERLKQAAQGSVAHAHAPKLLPGRPERAAAKRKPGRPAKRRAGRKAAARG